MLYTALICCEVTAKMVQYDFPTSQIDFDICMLKQSGHLQSFQVGVEIRDGHDVGAAIPVI